MAGSVNLVQVVNDSVTIGISATFSVANIHATAALTISTGNPTTPDAGGVTYGEVSLPAGRSFSWNEGVTGIQQITIDATGSEAIIAYS